MPAMYVTFLKLAHRHPNACVQVQRILGLLEEPYKDWSEAELQLPLAGDGQGRTWRADRPPPPELASLKCSCSS